MLMLLLFIKLVIVGDIHVSCKNFRVAIEKLDLDNVTLTFHLVSSMIVNLGEVNLYNNGE